MMAWQRLSTTSAGTIAVDFKPSRWVAAATVAVLACACGAVLSSSLPWLWRVGLASACLAYGGHSLRRFLRPPIHAVRMGLSGWILVDDGQVEHAARVNAWRRLGPLLVVEFRYLERHRFTCLLAPDNCPRAQRRQWLLALARGTSA